MVKKIISGFTPKCHVFMDFLNRIKIYLSLAPLYWYIAAWEICRSSTGKKMLYWYAHLLMEIAKHAIKKKIKYCWIYILTRVLLFIAQVFVWNSKENIWINNSMHTQEVKQKCKYIISSIRGISRLLIFRLTLLTVCNCYHFSIKMYSILTATVI